MAKPVTKILKSELSPFEDSIASMKSRIEIKAQTDEIARKFLVKLVKLEHELEYIKSQIDGV